MTTIPITTDMVADELESADFLGIISVPSDRPLPFTYAEHAVITTADGSVFLADIEEWHDCFRDGGECSYIFVTLT